MSSGSFFLINIPGLQEMNLGQHSGTDNPTHIVWTVDDHDGGATKSYTCAFCKRGFSNAQALGGHMNIHRKDRAKLKEAAEDLYRNQTLLSLDISSRDTSSSSTSPPPSEDALGIINTTQPPPPPPQPVMETEREQVLDLELRLGPEPPPPTTSETLPSTSSPPGTSTRGLFL
ncbi:unnamed protein product [Linum tenue]|uniref:C2H2-type domain-containing protein n=1 Tax=Linum tenue TaxID=586396 RepID=A0AAV0PIM4_9ROSI|nr:unnamed protein product [Linum tenue]